MASESTLEEDIAMLRIQIMLAKPLGIRGNQMGQRIEGDIKRLINSAWLNLAEYIADHNRQ